MSSVFTPEAASSLTVTLLDAEEKWLKMNSAGYHLMIHAEVKTNNEYTHIQ